MKPVLIAASDGISRGEKAKARAEFNNTVHGGRGLFAGIVFLFHVVNSGLPTLPFLALPAVSFLLRCSEYGVELFFCISGYVIAGTLRRSRSPLSFLADRAIRIFPALWATVLAIVLAGHFTGTRGFADLSSASLAWLLPANMLALPGILPFPLFHPAAWSLSYELAFYLACALGWSLRDRLGKPVLWVLVPLGVVGLGFYPRGLFFLCGVLAAEGLGKRRQLAALIRHPGWFLLAFLLLWQTIQVLTLPHHIIDTTLYEWMLDERFPVALLAFAAATIGFAGLVEGQGLLGRFLRLPPLQFMGTISYSFYLWHPIIMSGIKAAMVRFGLVDFVGLYAQLTFFALALPPALLISMASQRILERNVGLWLRRRMHHSAPLQTAAIAAQAGPVA
ncbi:acyltransferase [soil metagenome]